MSTLEIEAREYVLRLNPTSFDQKLMLGSNLFNSLVYGEDTLSAEVTVVPPSRLMALIGQALKWQQHQGLLPPGTQFDLFRGTAAMKQDEDDMYPTTLGHTIKVHEKDVIGVSYHPHRNLIVTYSEDCTMKIWKP
ncbi:hypothetical protein HHK36_001072 [Tetracentron sinense]|uniref:Uncharacterized protein n=1 Tax=Tetracentron sinense TaxID=13715 RepID=A0A834ZTB8_TETSI|nr:hypothetical protein HHK36_001072 [Tetracentron sinense]